MRRYRVIVAKTFTSSCCSFFFPAPPRISLDPGPTYVSAGENVTLPECHVTGFPRPVVTWAKVLDKLPVGRLVVGSQTLSILEARKADSGSYICKATSTAGSSRQATQIVVTVVPKFTLTPPPITEKFAGSSVSLLTKIPVELGPCRHVISVGQRSSPWPCKLSERRDKISSRVQAVFSSCTIYVAANASS